MKRSVCFWVGLWTLGTAVGNTSAAEAATRTYRFKEPRPTELTVLIPTNSAASRTTLAARSAGEPFLEAHPTGGATNAVYRIKRWVLVKPKPGASVEALLPGNDPQPVAAVPGWWRVATASPEEALALAETLSQDARVAAAYPEMRRPVAQHGGYAPAPDDPFFSQAFHLENRNADGSRAGADLNIRAAWPTTRGEGVNVAVVDDGIDVAHADLSRASAGTLHFNFVQEDTDVSPRTSSDNHGTAVAGIIAATTGNGVGVAGTAPDARLVGMRIFSGGVIPLSISDEDMAGMFRYRDDEVWVQNHSWGFASTSQSPASGMENEAVELGATQGRGGKGTVYVRSSGNQRGFAGNANEDGYLTNPHVIPVGAVRSDGRAASYSSPGANVLVAAPSSDTGFPGVPTTDRTGIAGSSITDYGTGSTAFTGTSAAAPQVSGLVALLLSVNTNLTVRDLQHLLVLSSRHIDLADPLVTTNGAGLRFSDNVGYGVPDAGIAVELARSWPTRPALNEELVSVTTNLFIPDDGVRLEAPLAPGTTNHAASPGLGFQPDSPTALVPLVNVGQALVPLTTNITGKAALIERGVNNFEEKIRFAAEAGAVFAVIYNNVGTTERVVMQLTDFSAIPAAFIGRTSGQLLAAALQQTNLSARLATVGATVEVPVTADLVCEHVLVRVRTTHPRRGQLRITLRSPSGTLAALQPTGDDASAGPSDWTYVSAQAFLESSRGIWSVTFSDQASGSVGTVVQVELRVRGVPILDTDRDGLDDDWELETISDLADGALDDRDGDGWNNAAEQVLGTLPLSANAERRIEVARWSPTLLRLSWPGSGTGTATVETAETPTGFGAATNVPSRFPVTEWFTPATNAAQFFRLAE